MKNPTLSIAFVSILLGITSSGLIASEAGRLQTTGYRLQEEATSTHSSVTTSVVTASDYCNFLNQFAIESDPKHLYNQAMA
ncbi:MAG: hypothetical protein ACH346_07570, partial [Chthoniobacterales bacterium]